VLCVLYLPVRVVIFAIVWLMTWGKLSFWLLPNLTEDVGFFDSFRPVYQCTFASMSESSDEDAALSGGDADKNAEPTVDAGEPEDGKEEEAEDHVEELEVAGEDEGSEDDENAGDDDNGDDNVEHSSDDDDVDNGEEQSVGTSDNGYEMISAEDIENGDHGDEAAKNGADKDDTASKPTVRWRKGKRRIT